MLAAVILVAVSLPPARMALTGTAGDGSIAGVLHVHTSRSDGRGSPDEVAAAAARAGLQFLMFTDHGDGTRIPDPPAYRSGVLCLDGVEISTSGGHYIAFGMAPSPYPLGGEPRDVVEDVRRLGGIGIVAHPDSPRTELQWRDWDLPFDGMEIVNLDTGWRLPQEASRWAAVGRLLGALLAYPFRPEEAMANLLTPDRTSLERYRSLANSRRIIGVAGSDAHARLDLWSADPQESGISLPLPGYESVFRALTVRVRPREALVDDPQRAEESLLAGIRAGHAYVAIDGVASPPTLRFTAERGQQRFEAGDELAGGESATLRVESNAPRPFTTRIWHDDHILAAGNRGEGLTVEATAAGAYIAEIRATDRSGEPPWIISNPIYIRGSAPLPPAATWHPQETRLLVDPGAWHPEAELTSLATVNRADTGTGVVLRYRLGDGDPVHQFAAAAVETPGGLGSYDRLRLVLRSDHDMRLSVQARVAVEPGRDDRWQRSLFVDRQQRERTVLFSNMTPIGQTATPRPRLGEVHSLVFVVDLAHARPGASGRVWFDEVGLQR